MKHTSLTLKTSLALIAAAGLTSQITAAPLVSLGSNFDIFALGSLKGQYNSNVLSNPGGPGKTEDYILTMSPGVELDYGRDSDTQANLNFHEDMLRYDKNPSLDANLANVAITASHDQGPLKVSANFSYIQAYTNNSPGIVGTVPLTTIIRSDVINTGAKATYDFTEKVFGDGAFNYSQTEYLGSSANGFQNYESYNLPFDLFYSYSAKVDVGVSYAFTQQTPQNTFGAPATQPNVGRSRYTNYGGVTVKLHEWEKLDGSASIGATTNHLDAAPGPLPGFQSVDTVNLGYNVNLAYSYTDKLNFSLQGSHSFNPGAQGQNIESYSANLGAHWDYSPTIYFESTIIGFTYSDYIQNQPVRHDDTYTTGVSAFWVPTKYLTLSAGYSYFMNSSYTPSPSTPTYNINVVTISASIRY